jgi:hypothetical protein
MEQMDSQPTSTPYITETHAIGDENVNLGFGIPQLAPPLSADHEVLRSDFEIISIAAMEHLYHRVTEDVNKTTAIAIKKSTDRLYKQIASLGTQISQLHQQILTYQHTISTPVTAPAMAPAKKILRTTLTKKAASGDTAGTATATANSTSTVVSATPQMPPTNTRGWETVAPKPQKPKVALPKLIPTNSPQAER